MVSQHVFQPDSKQACLLGMNALPELDFTLVRANGEALVKKVVSNPEMAQVRLVQGTTIPSLKGSFVEVQMDSQLGAVGSHLLFEPSQQLKSAGIHSLESLVTVCEDGWVHVSAHGKCPRCLC
jgi:hypothetical protein